MATTESSEVQKYWSGLSGDNLTQPTFDNAVFEFDLIGKQPKVCCLYIIHNDKECCYVVSQEKLDESRGLPGTTHMKAMQSYLHK